MHRATISSVLMTITVCLVGGFAYGADTTQGMPPAWRMLSPKEFCKVAGPEMAKVPNGVVPTGRLYDEIETHAAKLLSDDRTYVAGTAYEDLWLLHRWAWPKLPDDERAIYAHLLPPKEEVSRWNIQELQKKFLKMQFGRIDPANRQTLLASWVEANWETALLDFDPSDVKHDPMSGLYWAISAEQSGRGEAGSDPREFAVVWTGFVKAPYEGEYVFSVCPFNVNTTGLQHRTTVWVNGGQAVLAGPDSWAPDGRPVHLKANEETPLKVEYSFACNDKQIPLESPATVRLMWQGPGIARQTVPSIALVTPDHSQSGLQAEYRWPGKKGDFDTLTITEPTVDHIWFNDLTLAPANEQVRARIAEALLALAVHPKYLAALEAEPNRDHFLLKCRGEDASLRVRQSMNYFSLLNAEQQKAFLEHLMSHQQLLKPATFEMVFSLYQVSRMAAPDAALQVLGGWARLHATPEPAVAAAMGDDNPYYSYAALANSLTKQFPPHLEVFEQDYLVLPNGACCLPVAYVLTIGARHEGQRQGVDCEIGRAAKRPQLARRSACAVACRAGLDSGDTLWRRRRERQLLGTPHAVVGPPMAGRGMPCRTERKHAAFGLSATGGKTGRLR